jgi:hypothetical protein
MWPAVDSSKKAAVEQAYKAEIVQAIDRLRAGPHREAQDGLNPGPHPPQDIEGATYPTTWFDITAWQETAPSSPAPRLSRGITCRDRDLFRSQRHESAPGSRQPKGRARRATRWGVPWHIGISDIGGERVFKRIDVHGSHILVRYRDDTGGRDRACHSPVIRRACRWQGRWRARFPNLCGGRQ